MDDEEADRRCEALLLAVETAVVKVKADLIESTEQFDLNEEKIAFMATACIELATAALGACAEQHDAKASRMAFDLARSSILPEMQRLAKNLGITMEVRGAKLD